MTDQQRPRRTWLRSVVTVAVVAALGGITLIGATRLSGTSRSSEPSFAVYLQPADIGNGMALNVDAVREVLADRQFTVVTSAEQLEETVARENPVSIWIHDSALNDVSRDWLDTQKKNGKAIMGIDMSASRLASVMPMHASSADWKAEGYITYVVYGEAMGVMFTNDTGEPAERGGWTQVNDILVDVNDPSPLIRAVEDVLGQIRLSEVGE